MLRFNKQSLVAERLRLTGEKVKCFGRYMYS